MTGALALELIQYDLIIGSKPGKLNVLLDILSCNPNHIFDPQVLEDLNTGMMLPSTTFSLIDGNYCAFCKKVLDSQKSSPLRQRILKAALIGNLNRSFNSYLVSYGVIHYYGQALGTF